MKQSATVQGVLAGSFALTEISTQVPLEQTCCELQLGVQPPPELPPVQVQVVESQLFPWPWQVWLQLFTSQPAMQAQVE